MWPAVAVCSVVAAGCLGYPLTPVGQVEAVLEMTIGGVSALQEREARRDEAAQHASDEDQRQRENAAIRDTEMRLELERRASQGTLGASVPSEHAAPAPPTCIERRRARMREAQALDNAGERMRILSRLPPCDELPEALDRALITSAVARVKPRLTACGARSAIEGTVEVHLVVGSDGAVADVSIDRAPEVELAMCVVAAVRAASFRQTRNGGSFRYRFVFTAS